MDIDLLPLSANMAYCDPIYDLNCSVEDLLEKLTPHKNLVKSRNFDLNFDKMLTSIIIVSH